MANGDIKIICNWCNKHIGNKEGLGIDRVSHSVCHDCLDSALKRPFLFKKPFGRSPYMYTDY
jgi:hypothetical protein